MCLMEPYFNGVLTADRAAHPVSLNYGPIRPDFTRTVDFRVKHARR